MDHTESATATMIRCEIDTTRADLAAPLLRTFVHHQCVLVDCDVETLDALEAAVTEVIATVRDRHGTVEEIEFLPDPARIDIALSIRLADAGTNRAFVRGPIARAVSLRAHFGPDGRLRLWHRFEDRGDS